MALHATVLSLPEELLSQTFKSLGWIDLISAGQSCRRFRDAAMPYGTAWEACCRRRWAGPLNTSLFLEQGPQGTSKPATVNWRRLFAADNGWSDTQLPAQWWEGGVEVSVAVALSTELDAMSSTVLAYGSSSELCMVSLGNSDGIESSESQGARWRGIVPSCGEGQPAGLPTSLAVIDGSRGLLAMGSWLGHIAVCQLPEQRDYVDPAPSRVAASWHRCRAPVVELHHLPTASRLLALHDGLGQGEAATRDGLLRLLDAQTGQGLYQAREVFDGYSLAACTAADERGHELLAASSKLSDSQQAGQECLRCPVGIPASLCYHKARSSTAALCTFDTRAAAGMVQRFATAHRSIYPRLQLVRQHFLATSHAGTPLALWDRRRLNGPVHEVQHLPNLCDGQPLPMPLPPCEDRPFNQALHLHATQDLVVGRADNGMVWLWDLSERLGWADGSQPGSWLEGLLADVGDAAEAGGATTKEGVSSHLDERDYDRSPLPLGCMPPPWPVPIGGPQGAAAWTPRPAVWVGHCWLAGLASHASAVEGAGAAGAAWEEAEGEEEAGDAQPNNAAFWASLVPSSG